MKIGIYARGLSTKGGVKRFIEDITKEFIVELNKKDELYILHNLDRKPFKTQKKNVNQIRIPFQSRLIADYITTPFLIHKYKIDVVFFPKQVIPFLFNSKAKTALTIHGMIPFLTKLNAFPFWTSMYMQIMMRSSIRRADIVLASSLNTKKDIESFINLGNKSVKHLPLAVSKEYEEIVNKKALKSVQSKYDLPQKYILYTGNFSKRKNLLRLVKSYNKIKKDIDQELVITGIKNWTSQNEFYTLVEKNNSIKIIGYVEDKDMPALYSLADLYVYPTLYEGFGLPILEAQACGCPVLTSKISSCPEVAGDGAFYVDPYSISKIANGITEVLTNTKLRKDLIKKGKDNIKRFSWKKSAQDLYDIIRQSFQ